ncbi:MAG: hypothetical protein AAFO84_14430 [Cyanobacteria bacterium J06598_1]
MTAIHWIGGEKGGVGKSFVCRSAIEYFQAKDFEFIVFDTDRSNPDVLRLYKLAAGCRPAILSEAEKYEVAAGTIYNAALEEKLPVLVNLGAASFRSLMTWIEKNYVLRSAKLNDITFYNWFVSNGGSGSLRQFGEALDYFGDSVQHVFVKNYGMTDDWSALDDDTALMKRINDENVIVIDFPRFVGNLDRNRIENLGLTFAAAQQHEAFDTLAQQRIKFYLDDVFDEFERAGVFGG